MAPIVSIILGYKYLLLFALALVEGPIVMILGGFLLKLGYVGFWPAYLTLMAGDLTADLLWYALGYYGARPVVLKYGKFLSIDRESLDKTEKIFKKHPGKILFLSKITMGFGFALVVLITAGISRVPLRKYFLFNFLGGFVWTAFLLGVGYLFGEFYATLRADLQLFSIIGFAMLLLAGFYGFSRYLKRKDLEERLS